MSIYPRENFRRGITPNIRMRKDAVGANNGGVEVGLSNNETSEPFLKEDEEEMEKEQKRRKKEVREQAYIQGD